MKRQLHYVKENQNHCGLEKKTQTYCGLEKILNPLQPKQKKKKKKTHCGLNENSNPLRSKGKNKPIVAQMNAPNYCGLRVNPNPLWPGVKAHKLVRPRRKTHCGIKEIPDSDNGY